MTTPNQVVAWNMARYRKAAGLSQAELGKRLGGWSAVSVSAAERSWDGKRIRKFDADELIAVASALGVPVFALFLPPDGTTLSAAVHEAEGQIQAWRAFEQQHVGAVTAPLISLLTRQLQEVRNASAKHGATHVRVEA